MNQFGLPTVLVIRFIGPSMKCIFKLEDYIYELNLTFYIVAVLCWLTYENQLIWHFILSQWNSDLTYKIKFGIKNYVKLGGGNICTQ